MAVSAEPFPLIQVICSRALQSDIFVPDPAFEKQMVRAINRGPLVQGPAQELASIEQILAQSNEMAKGLFIDDLGGEMTAELL